jgi:hypothetical protein
MVYSNGRAAADSRRTGGSVQNEELLNVKLLVQHVSSRISMVNTEVLFFKMRRTRVREKLLNRKK